ncbi:MD-2-related lipid-recognition protein-like [Daktulosphaira vitifoliae]|uniref:MD-2-related lipid-recognition protein-like n=1 Tax=Daktulosphaira vitifoliae TaxID=58002 RepID=UPI0021A9A82B|nr:MD-2-related lipid-recognition protein-like [Daktulosphaira vitifoliae]
MKYVSYLFILGTILSARGEEVTDYEMCKNSKCTISNVNVDPCPQALKGEHCEFVRGTNVTFSANYITSFGTVKPITKVYIEVGGVEITDPSLPTDACLFTSCPIQNGKQNSYKRTILVSPKYPSGNHNFKIKIYDGTKKFKRDECCVQSNVKII